MEIKTYVGHIGSMSGEEIILYVPAFESYTDASSREGNVSYTQLCNEYPDILKTIITVFATDSSLASNLRTYGMRNVIDLSSLTLPYKIYISKNLSSWGKKYQLYGRRKKKARREIKGLVSFL